MPESIEFPEILTLKGTSVFIDVRSEDEYLKGHIPGAVNIPILPNEARKIVGTLYKQSGKEEAIKAGFELVSKNFGDYFEAYRQVALNKNAVFYCWRGGLRSQIASTIFGWGGYNSTLIKGGYKNYRNHVLRSFIKPQQVIIISGYTGVGKTEILGLLEKSGHQTIDLEGLAHHKGSVLGGLGMPVQPSQEMFENNLSLQWSQMDGMRPVFIENESRKIGTNVLPEALWNQMLDAPILDLELDPEARLKRILLEYGNLPVLDLKMATEKIKKRLGGLNLKLALEALDSGNIGGWAHILMGYYDRTYEHSRLSRNMKKTQLIWNWNDTQNSINLLLNGAEREMEIKYKKQ